MKMGREKWKREKNKTQSSKKREREKIYIKNQKIYKNDEVVKKETNKK